MKEFYRLIDPQLNNRSRLVEGRVSGIGTTGSRYVVTLRNGTQLANVVSAISLTVGDNVVVAAGDGKNKSWSVVGKAAAKPPQTTTTFYV